MSQNQDRVSKIIREIEKVKRVEAYAKQLLPMSKEDLDKLEPNAFQAGNTRDAVKSRRDFLKEKGTDLKAVHDFSDQIDPETLNGNIENFVGMAQIPIGLAGPLKVNGLHAQGDYFVPLATTEGALVASYNRGMKACRQSGGITTICLSQGVQRSPFFKFDTILTVGLFLRWVHEHIPTFHKIVSKTSRFAELMDMKTNVEGNSVILTFEYETGDASGQNMVTICTDQICKYILENFSHQPIEWYIESNYSGDKKATAISFSNVRGRKVTSEIVIPKEIVAGTLKSTPEKIANYWRASTLAVTQSGAIGAQGHVANGLTALFISCGQDVACISESSIGLTRMEVNSNGDLYLAVTMPSLIVGTVGGGTSLPTQKECLEMIDCYGAGNSAKFAEICCALSLTGELSIASAMSADHFTSAHKSLGRKKDA